jgi:Tfp pilus assembly protein PilO
MAAKKGTWIGATAFAACVIGAATWFGAVSPTLTQAADLRAQTDQVNQSNNLLQAKVQKLAADYKKLPDYKKQLDTLRIQIPTTAQLSDYVRQVQTIADAHQVVVTNMQPDTAKAFTLAQSAAAAPSPAPTDTASPDASASTSTATTGSGSTPAASAVPAGLAAIPMSITVLGTYDNTLAFLNDVQTATPRLLLVSGIQGTSQKDATASGGRPATHVGDQELVITGFLYVLPDPTAAPAPAPTTTAPALPAPVPGKNPLVPVAGK